MISFRNGVAAGLLLFGASYLWLTPAFLARAGFRGTIWDPKGFLALVAIVGFAAAAWGVWKNQGWWVPVAIAAGVIGLLSVVPFWIWTLPGADNRGAAIENGLLHALGGAAVAAILLVPATEHWLANHL